MTKEELKKLGLDEEQIKEVFRLNGIAVNNAKKELETLETEAKTLQGQLEAANKEIESFKDLDLEGIKQAAEDYKTKFEEAEAKAKKELEEIQFEHELEGMARDFKAKNIKAALALLDKEELKESKNRKDDMKKAFESISEENSYLFGDDAPKGTGGSLGAGSKGDVPLKEKVQDFLTMANEASIRK